MSYVIVETGRIPGPRIGTWDSRFCGATHHSVPPRKKDLERDSMEDRHAVASARMANPLAAETGKQLAGQP